MGCSGSTSRAAKPEPGAVDLAGVGPVEQPPVAAPEAAAPTAATPSAVAAPAKEATPVAPVAAPSEEDRYGALVATQAEPIAALFRQLDIDGSGRLEKSELAAVVAQYTGAAFNEEEFFGWYDIHGTANQKGKDGQLDLREFGWYIADVALSFGEDKAAEALPQIIAAFSRLADSRTPLLTRCFAGMDPSGSGAVDFAAFRKVVSSGVMLQFFDYMDAIGIKDGKLTLDEFLKGMAQLGAKMSNEQFETELRSLLQGCAPASRTVHAEKTAIQLGKIFRSIDTDGSGAVSVAELRAKMRNDAEMQALLGMSGAWSLYVMRQLDAGGDGKVSLPEFQTGLAGFVAAREAALDALAAQHRALDVQGSENVPRYALRYALRCMPAAELQLIQDAGGSWAFFGLQEMLTATTEQLLCDGPISRKRFLGSLQPPRDAAIERLKRLFYRLDKDSSGTVSRSELRECLAKDDAIQKLLVAAGGTGEFFVLEQLDADADGSITLAEFKAGLER